MSQGPTPPPLAAAAARLRGRPGRPRTRPDREAREPIHTLSVGSLTPRLVDLEGAARFLSISTWAVRDLIDAGRLRRVRLPGAGAGDLRRVLLDVEDLARLVDTSKDTPPLDNPPTAHR